MKYIKQVGIILLVTVGGEVLRYLLPLPVPASIYGLCLMLFLLMTGIVKLEQVKDVGLFLVEIMPLMFIPAAVGLLDSWSTLQGSVVPFFVITVAVTFVVMIVSGKVTDFLLDRNHAKMNREYEGDQPIMGKMGEGDQANIRTTSKEHQIWGKESRQHEYE